MNSQVVNIPYSLLSSTVQYEGEMVIAELINIYFSDIYFSGFLKWRTRASLSNTFFQASAEIVHVLQNEPLLLAMPVLIWKAKLRHQNL